jgi:hypothetical protein
MKKTTTHAAGTEAPEKKKPLTSFSKVSDMKIPDSPPPERDDDVPGA